MSDMMNEKINILAVDDVEMNQSMLEFMLADVTDNFFQSRQRLAGA